MRWWQRDRPFSADWLATRLIARPRWHPPVGNRSCSVHPFLRACDRCDHCGQPFCASCLQHVARWRVCRECLDRLRQERIGPSPVVRRDRWRTARPNLLAALAIGLALTAIVVLATGMFGQAGSPTSTAGAAQRSGCLEQYPDRGRLSIVGGFSLGEFVPASLVLRNCGFQPGEAFQVEARFDGSVQERGVHNLLVGSVSGRASAEGELAATLVIPTHAEYRGYYDLHLRATGEQGSFASRDLHGGEKVVPAASSCPPAPRPCPGTSRPARSLD